MNPLAQPHRNRVVALLACAWLLCVVLAVIMHWRVFAMFGSLILVVAIVFFMLSIVYSMLDGNKSAKPKSDQEGPAE